MKITYYRIKQLSVILISVIMFILAVNSKNLETKTLYLGFVIGSLSTLFTMRRETKDNEILSK